MKNNSSKNKDYLLMIVVLSMLIAMEIVLSRFLAIVKTEQLKISFAFIPLAVASYMYGIKGGIIVGALSDIVGAIAFPIGAYFPGFTVTAAFNGLIFGLFLGKKSVLSKGEKKPKIIIPAVISVLITQIVGSLFINTYWIAVFISHAPYFGVLLPRLAQTGVMIAVEIIIIPLFIGAFDKIKFIKSMRI